MLRKGRRSTKSAKRVVWEGAPDVKKRLTKLSSVVGVNWLIINQITCFRSKNSKARAYARIWGLSSIWQQALDLKPHYIIEVLAENYDELSDSKKDEVLMHELAHIPKNFSGSLLPHFRRGKRNFHGRVKKLINDYLDSSTMYRNKQK